MILAPMAAALVQMAISRTREYSADRDGAEICGNPGWLATALQKIEQLARGRLMPTAERNPASAHMFIINPLIKGGIDNLFRTHPPTEERVRRLLAMGGRQRDCPAWHPARDHATAPWQCPARWLGPRLTLAAANDLGQITASLPFA